MKSTLQIILFACEQARRRHCFFYVVIRGLLLLLLWPPLTLAATELEDLEYSSLPEGEVHIRLELSGSAPQPQFFAMDDPPSIVLDLPGVEIGSAQRFHNIDIGMTRNVTLVEGRERTRVVVNLVKNTPFKVKAKEDTVHITVSGSPAKSGGTASAEQRVIENIEFSRGEQGKGRITITLSNTQMSPNIRREGKHIIIDFANSTLPLELERRLNVLDFATPVKFIDAFTTEQGARIVIIPRSAKYEYLSYQYDSTLVVELKSISKDQKAPVLGREPGYSGKKVTLNFQSIKLRTVLWLLVSDFAGLNLVVSDAVQGTVTLRLQGVPWDQALNVILRINGLAMRRSGDVVLIAPREKIAARERQELKARKQRQKLAPLHSAFIRVNYAKADDLAALLEAEENSLLSPRGNVAVDERTNTLLVRDTADRLADIRELVIRLDIPVQQVLIESRIVIASRDFSKELGVRFGLSKRDSIDGPFDQVVTSGSLDGTTQILNGSSLNSSDRLNVNLPVTREDAAQLALALTNLPLGTLLELELSALQAEGRGKVISNPRVITSNHHKAVIQQGVQIPYQEATSSGATSVSFKEAMLSLTVTPQITPDGRIIMDLTVTKNSVGQIFNGVPSIDTRKISTRVLVDNGQTVVLGGIYEQQENHTIRRVPFLGSLPYIGALFRSKAQTHAKTELLIFVTPKIVTQKMAL